MVSVKRPDPGDPHMGGAYMARKGEGSVSSQPDESTETFEVDLEGMTPDQARQWVNVQIPYPNLAADKDVAHRAVEYVKKVKQRWDEGTKESQEKWRSMQWMLRGGNTLARRFDEEAIHVAELYKLVEALIPRIEEAIIGNYDPWFAAMGRTKLRQSIASKLTAYLMSQMRDDNFEQKVQPSIRAMLEYSFCGFKIHWDIETAWRMTNNVEKLKGRGKKRRYRITKEEKEMVVWNGPRIRLLDPLDMIVDLRSVLPPGDCLWIGDKQWMTLEELRSAATMFGYENIDAIEAENEATPQSGYSEFNKQSRSLERFNQNERDLWTQGAPKRVEVTELWCMFDPTGGDQATPHVITVANDKWCLRVQENFHDDKHAPYAIARVSREGWEFLNVGPLDHALNIQESIDHHRNLANKSHENHLCPPLFADDTSGLPDNMFDVAPGSVWQAKPGSLEWMPAPSTLRDYIGMLDVERRDLEEIMGSPRIWEGTGGQEKTATGIERKVQEANRRVRSFVLSYAFMMKNMLEQLHALNKQFLTQDQTFRVIGKAAKDLGMYTQIGPNDVQHDVEFDFVGLGALRTLDLRATQIQTWLSTMYPFIQMQPGTIDISEVLRESWDVMVGTKPADAIVKNMGNLDEIMPQDEENYILLTGEPLKVHPLDDDLEHLRQMSADFPEIKSRPKLEKEHGEDAAEAILQHMAQHVMAWKQKQLRRKAQAQMIPPVPQQAQYDAGRGTTGERQVNNLPGGGDQGGVGNMAGIAGQTPGPGMAHQVGAPDRTVPVTQPQNIGGGSQ